MKKITLLFALILSVYSVSGQIFSEDFENGQPASWTFDAHWATGTATTMSSQYFPYPDHTTFAGVNDDDAGDGVNTSGAMETPLIDLTTATFPVLKFDLFFLYASYNGAQETFKVNVSTDNGGSWTQIAEDMGGADWRNIEYSLADYVGQNIKISFDYYDGAGWTYGVGVDNVSVEELPSVDLSLESLNMSLYAPQANPYDISGAIKNVGADNITSFDVVYSVGGVDSSVYSVSGVNVAYGQTYDFTHNVPYNFTSKGIFDFDVTISNVNGGGEVELTNNTLPHIVTAYNQTYQRKVILENFTTGQCPNCPPVHTMLEGYVANHSNAILIAQHAGYYTDEMTVDENTELLAMYNDGGSVYAPALAVDRFHFPTGLGGGAVDPGPVFFPSNTGDTYARIDDRTAVLTFVSVNINGTLNGTSLELDVTGDFVNDIAGTLNLVVYVIEDGIIANQAGATADYTHNNVMRDALSATWGDDLGVTATDGNTYSKHYSYTLDGSWDTSKMSVVAFIAKSSTDVNQREVFNAEKVVLSQLTPLAISDDEITRNIKIYPTLTNSFVTVENAEGFDLSIFDMLGREIFKKQSLLISDKVNVSNLNKGTYFITLTSQNAQLTKKIIITK